MPEKRSAGRRIPTDRRKRRRKLVLTTARAYRRQAVSKIRARFAPEDKKREIIREAYIKSAEDAARTLGGMKGVVMKMGQMAAVAAPGLDEGVRNELSVLQQEAPPMAWSLAREQLESELERDLSDVFEEIDPEPAAAASIGQVHWARLIEGDQVAVKVQYPAVDEAIRADLANVGLLKMILRRALPGVDIDPYVAEFAARLEEELDYRIEAKNQSEFASLWEGDGVVLVPKVYEDFTTRRVLVTEWFDGARFDEKWDSSQEERNRIGCEIYRYTQTCIGRYGLFNGDPHPGNYIFLDDGRIVFLDFGCVKRLERSVLDAQRQVLEATRAQDPPGVVRALREAGYLRTDDAVDPDRIFDFVRRINEPIVHDRDFRFSDKARRKMARAFSEPSNPEGGEPFHGLRLPADLLFMMRLNVGVSGILGRLQAEANWYRIHDEAWSRDRRADHSQRRRGEGD